jgi:hypothetical protein
MEVHAHTHPEHSGERKRFTHYLWEFLMLFLAVFCGFLAENQREHIMEHQREKQYMSTLLEDLKSDTSLLRVTVQYWDTINHSIDSVAAAIRFPLTNANLIQAYRYLNKALDYYSFRYNDRTITQLKNAGGFRLIRNKVVANKIIAFDQFNNDAIINIRDQHNSFYETTVQLRNKVFVQEIINTLFDRFDFLVPPPAANKWIDSMINKNKSPIPAETQSILMFEFKNALLAYLKDFSNMNYGYRNLKIQMDDLIRLIHENYNLN